MIISFLEQGCTPERGDFVHPFGEVQEFTATSPEDCVSQCDAVRNPEALAEDGVVYNPEVNEYNCLCAKYLSYQPNPESELWFCHFDGGRK